MNWAYFTSNSITAPKEVSCFLYFLEALLSKNQAGWQLIYPLLCRYLLHKTLKRKFKPHGEKRRPESNK